MADEKMEQIGWRIPAQMKAEIDALAKADRRQINTMGLILLEEALAARKQAAKLAKKAGNK
jgi:hypothetical protein